MRGGLGLRYDADKVFYCHLLRDFPVPTVNFIADISFIIESKITNEI